MVLIALVHWLVGGLWRRPSFLFVFDKMAKKSTTMFLLPQFDEGNFPMCKVKIHVILVKDGGAIALKGKDQKS